MDINKTTYLEESVALLCCVTYLEESVPLLCCVRTGCGLTERRLVDVPRGSEEAIKIDKKPTL